MIIINYTRNPPLANALPDIGIQWLCGLPVDALPWPFERTREITSWPIPWDARQNVGIPRPDKYAVTHWTRRLVPVTCVRYPLDHQSRYACTLPVSPSVPLPVPVTRQTSPVTRACDPPDQSRYPCSLPAGPVPLPRLATHWNSPVTRRTISPVTRASTRRTSPITRACYLSDQSRYPCSLPVGTVPLPVLTTCRASPVTQARYALEQSRYPSDHQSRYPCLYLSDQSHYPCLLPVGLVPLPVIATRCNSSVTRAHYLSGESRYPGSLHITEVYYTKARSETNIKICKLFAAITHGISSNSLRYPAHFWWSPTLLS